MPFVVSESNRSWQTIVPSHWALLHLEQPFSLDRLYIYFNSTCLFGGSLSTVVPPRTAGQKLRDQSCIWGVVHTKIHLISQDYPRAQYNLTMQNHGLKHLKHCVLLISFHCVSRNMYPPPKPTWYVPCSTWWRC